MRERENIERDAVFAQGVDKGNETRQESNRIIIELLLDIRELLAQPTLHHDHGKLLDSLSTSQE